ncbi:hypothetical protein [Burkholderia anthina]|uniref:hypothetical protein n=1 Tax=Burkholderia anthina TaxID=179879 RepID=UPI00158E460E
MNQVFDGNYFDPRLSSEKGFDLSNNRARNEREIKNLVVMQYNETLGSLMLDFSVSTFSAFEFWVDRLYNNFCPGHTSAILERRVKKISDQIKKYAKNPSEDVLGKTIKEISGIPGKFISLPDKIAGLTKSIDEGSYKRNMREDIDIINFMAAQRNTVHNLGLHRGSQKTINVKGVNYSLDSEKAAKFESWKHLFDIIVELVKIYTALLSSIPDTVNHIAGLVQEEVAVTSIEFLTNIINDFFAQENHPGESSNNKEIFCNILIGKLNFSSQQAGCFVELLLKSGKLEFDLSDTLEFLAIPNPK